MKRASAVKIAVRLSILGAVFFLFAWGGYERTRQALTIYREKQGRDERLRILEEQNENMRRELDRLGTLSAIEREAKERFNLKLPGESVTVVVAEEAARVAPSGEDHSLWSRVAESIRKILSP